VPLDRLRILASIDTDGLVPHQTIQLDHTLEEGLARKSPGDVTRFEAEFDLDFHGRVRAGFLAIAGADPTRVAVIDASADIDTVAAAIASVVDDRLGLGSEPEATQVRTTR
jgi:dTMP kinase